MKLFRNPFTPAAPVHDGLFVDREAELDTVISWLHGGHGSLVITGERGIGKSSLALKATDLAKGNLSDTHLIFTSVYKFHARSFDLLLSELALEICISIWQEILGGKFSDLFEDSFPTPGKTIEAKDAAIVKRIYNILKAASVSAKACYFKSLGGKFFVEGKLQETDEQQVSRKALTVYEFLALIDELKTVCSSYGRSRIVVVADEFNYLHESEQQKFLQDFFEILNSRKVLFVLIGVNLDSNVVPGFRQCVETTIQMGPFPSYEYTKELIVTGISSCPDLEFFRTESFRDEDFKLIHEVAQGNPRIVQEFCYQLFFGVYENNISEMTSERLDRMVSVFQQQRREQEARLREYMNG